jgi:hypothetical protein
MSRYVPATLDHCVSGRNENGDSTQNNKIDWPGLYGHSNIMTGSESGIARIANENDAQGRQILMVHCSMQYGEVAYL